MSHLDSLLARLPDVKEISNGWSARCPAHDDQRASLSISTNGDAKVLMKCHAGCDTGAVLSAVGMKMADLFPTHPGAAPGGKSKQSVQSFPTAEAALEELERRLGNRSAMWKYLDVAGKPIGLVIRWDRPEGKQIRPVALNGP